jgi:hypothetical protein
LAVTSPPYGPGVLGQIRVEQRRGDGVEKYYNRHGHDPANLGHHGLDDMLAGFTQILAVRGGVVLPAPAQQDSCIPAVTVTVACRRHPASPGGRRGEGGFMPARFFTGHEAAVVEAATARIAPGPQDDPAEAGHPGAREARVTCYIDMMLGGLDALDALDGTAAMIFAGGPWSNRHTSGPDHMASFIPLDPVARIAWFRRLVGWRQLYRQGIADLDSLAGGDFTKVGHADQDKILAAEAMGPFRALLFGHTIEGLYANPEYGGNHGRAGWEDISYPGDVQPRGYSADEVELSDGFDPLADDGIVADVLKFLSGL